jgi:hypothetical protein
MSKRNQIGSVHVAILSAVVLIIVGAAGYLFWNNFIANEKSDSTKEVSKSSKTNVSPSPTPTTDASKLTLSDWKITFSIPDTLKDTSIKYYERRSNDNPSVAYYAFTTKRIQDLGGQCASQTFGDTVILNRFSEDQPAYPDSYWVSPDKVDGYRYVLSGPIASCSGTTADGQATQKTSQAETSDKESLIKLLESIKSAK